jgi:hypothetical protein
MKGRKKINNEGVSNALRDLEKVTGKKVCFLGCSFSWG